MVYFPFLFLSLFLLLSLLHTYFISPMSFPPRRAFYPSNLFFLSYHCSFLTSNQHDVHRISVYNYMYDMYDVLQEKLPDHLILSMTCSIFPAAFESLWKDYLWFRVVKPKNLKPRLSYSLSEWQWVRFFHTKSVLNFVLHKCGCTYSNSAAYVNLEIPSAFERRTLPLIDKSFKSHRLNFSFFYPSFLRLFSSPWCPRIMADLTHTLFPAS